MRKDRRLMNRWQRKNRHEMLEPRYVLDSTVVFNELMYNPAGDESLEWVELHNQMSVDVELSDWTIDGGIEYRFPRGTVLESGAYLLVAANPELMEANTGLENVHGPFAGRLSNGGEQIRLVNHTERLMNQLTYGDGREPSDRWTAVADGSGASLAKMTEGGTFDDPERWTHSRELGGTPGSQNFKEIGAFDRDVLLPIDATWRYDQSGTSPDASWITPQFDDESWLSGPALLFAETSDLDAEKNTPLELGPTTYYFRSTFEVDTVPEDASLRISHFVDDGAVFYLNGEEVLRYRMPDGPIDADTLATRSTRNASLETGLADLAQLQLGTNTLAVEIHQSSLDNDDVVFWRRIVAKPDRQAKYRTGRSVAIHGSPRPEALSFGRRSPTRVPSHCRWTVGK